jgi:hypothetical protein
MLNTWFEPSIFRMYSIESHYIASLLVYQLTQVTANNWSVAFGTAALFAPHPIHVESVAAVVNSSPGTLNTLRELASALANDANFAVSTTNLIATKISVANTKLYLANTNTYIATKSSWSSVTGTNTALRTLISDRLQVSNANAKFATKAYAASNTYVNSLLGGGGGSTAYEKTFTIAGLVSAPLAGTARVVPISNTTITKIQLVNGGTVNSDLTVRLNKNGSSVNTYTISSGNYVGNYTGLSIPITSSDYLTVDVVSGSSSNFNLTISS